MKLIYFVLLGTASAAYQPFQGYLEKVDSCMGCIDMIGQGKYSKICMG
jgi:hypothetical protein